MARKLNPTEQAQLDRMAGRTSLKAILTGLLASFTMQARYAATEEAKKAYQEQAAAVTVAIQNGKPQSEPVKCEECGSPKEYDAWVDSNGDLTHGPYDDSQCSNDDCPTRAD
jgi:hypothetical protein